jgi:hypothetical protein
MLSTLVLITCLSSGALCQPTIVGGKLPWLVCRIEMDAAAREYAKIHPERKVLVVGCADAERVEKWVARHQA